MTPLAKSREGMGQGLGSRLLTWTSIWSGVSRAVSVCPANRTRLPPLPPLPLPLPPVVAAGSHDSRAPRLMRTTVPVLDVTVMYCIPCVLEGKQRRVEQGRADRRAQPAQPGSLLLAQAQVGVDDLGQCVGGVPFFREAFFQEAFSGDLMSFAAEALGQLGQLIG